MDWLVSLWSDSNSVGHILLVYAIVITVGLLLGRIKIFGISLGVTFVLFAGLAAGYFGFTVNTTVLHFLRDFGLILFVFFIGLHRQGSVLWRQDQSGKPDNLWRCPD